MSNQRKRSSSRVMGRGQKRRVRRPVVEALERRDCPAVMFGFDPGLGILSITGDEGPNVIEFVQRSDGMVEALGDGEQRTFAGVHGIVAHTGDGDDQIHSHHTLFMREHNRISNTTPFRLDLNAGAGNDKVTIDDDRGSAPFQRINLVQFAVDISANLGTGADDLLVALENHPTVSLNVLSEDGGDRVAAPILINLCQPPGGGPSFPCNLRASLQLGGGDNDVDVSAVGFDLVDLDVDASGDGNRIYISTAGGGLWKTTDGGQSWISLELGGGDNLVKVSSEDIDQLDLNVAAFSGGNTVEINEGWGPWEISPARVLNSHANLMLLGDGNNVGFKTEGYDQVDLDLDLTGNGNTVALGLLLPAVQSVRQAAARISLEFGGGGNRLNAEVGNFDNVMFSTKTSIAAPSREPDAGHARDSYVQGTFAMVPEGNDQPGQPRLPSRLVLREHTNDAAGGVDGDIITIQGTGFGVVSIDVNTTGGNDSIWIDMAYPVQKSVDGRVANTSGAQLNVVTLLGAGDDSLTAHSDGYTDATYSINAGDGLDLVALSDRAGLYPALPEIRISEIHYDNYLGTGDDNLSIDADGFGDVTSVIDADAGDDVVRFRDPVWHDIPITRVKTYTTLGTGNDSLEIEIVDYSEVTTSVDAGDGDDTIVAAARATPSDGVGAFSRVHYSDYNLGDGNDVLKEYVEGYDQATAAVDAGAGNDRFNGKYLLSDVTHSYNDDASRLSFTALLGQGSDTCVLETFGYRAFDATFDTGLAGDGRDTIATRHVRMPARGLVSRIFLTPDGGLDTADFFALGYDTHTVEQIGDTATHEVGRWLG